MPGAPQPGQRSPTQVPYKHADWRVRPAPSPGALAAVPRGGKACPGTPDAMRRRQRSSHEVAPAWGNVTPRCDAPTEHHQNQNCPSRGCTAQAPAVPISSRAVDVLWRRTRSEAPPTGRARAPLPAAGGGLAAAADGAGGAGVRLLQAQHTRYCMHHSVSVLSSHCGRNQNTQGTTTSPDGGGEAGVNRRCPQARIHAHCCQLAGVSRRAGACRQLTGGCV